MAMVTSRIMAVVIAASTVFHYSLLQEDRKESSDPNIPLQNARSESANLLLYKSSIGADEARGLLAEHQELEELTIVECRALEGLACSEQLALSLKKLTVHDSPVGDSIETFVARCGKLESLSLKNCCVSSHALGKLRWPESLSRFSISGLPFNDTAFEKLAACPNLENLSLERCAVSDRGVVAVMPKLNVDRVSLSGSLVSDACVGGISECESLSSVSVGFTLITSAGVVQLCKNENISTLDLSGIPLDSKAIHALASMPRLDLLIARKCHLTEAEILRILSESSSISSIWLDYGDITPASEERIRGAFPDVALQVR